MTDRLTAPGWTDEELGFLADHTDWTAKRIAQELGRSVSGVRQKRRQIRDGWLPRLPAWTEDELDVLRTTVHLSPAQVAGLAGRSPRAVQSMRNHLARTEGIDWGGKGVNRRPYHVGLRRLVAKTCVRCGELMDAKWYRRDQKSGCWSTTCGSCRRGRYRPEEVERLREKRRDGHRSRHNFQLLTEPAQRGGQPYTEDDHRVLSDPDLTILEKALRVKRTYKATVAALSRFEYASKIGLGDPEGDVWRIFNPNETAA